MPEEIPRRNLAFNYFCGWEAAGNALLGCCLCSEFVSQ